MQRRFVIDRDLFSGFNVSQRQEENVIVMNLHERIWLAAMVYVMRSIPAPTAVQAPTVVDTANT